MSRSTGRRLEPLVRSAREIEALGRRALRPCCDVGDPDRSRSSSRPSRRRSAGSTSRSTMPASSAPAVPMEDLTYAQWKTVVDANLTGAFLCAQGAIRHHEAAVARRADASSTTARSRPTRRARTARPIPRPSTRSPGLTKSIALDGRPFDIACGQIDIGNALTEMALQDDARRPAGRRPHRDRADDGSPTRSARRSSTWRACRSRPTS